MVFAFPFVRLYIHVCMFVCPSIVFVDFCIKVFKMLYYQGLLMD